MGSFETKKLALIRIWQILNEYSDIFHPLTQEEIALHLNREYGIVMERKAISRNISLLKEAGVEIESTREGTYLFSRTFEDAELHMIIDGILSSKYITARHSKALIEKLCGLSNRYFKSHVKNIYSVNEWGKTDNQALFYNIEIVDEAIEQHKQIEFDYNKYGVDKKLHKTSRHFVSPYQLVLQNQRYYLMGRNERWGDMTFYRLDYITNMCISEKTATSIRSISGYENGIDYKQISCAMPYMYTDKPEIIEFVANIEIVDQIIDWFGKEITIEKYDDKKVKVRVKTSPSAMEHWILQYISNVEVLSPESFRVRIKECLQEALKNY